MKYGDQDSGSSIINKVNPLKIKKKSEKLVETKEEIKKTNTAAPIKSGQKIINNIANTNINIVATKTIKKMKKRDRCGL